MAAKLLLDTHALIWWWLGDPALSSTARAAMAADDSAIFVSAVSAIEVAIKVRRGQLPAMMEPLLRYDENIADDGWRHLAIRSDHAIKAGLMRGGHSDPFDRIIAAQAMIEDMTVVTRDPALAAFGCKVLW